MTLRVAIAHALTGSRTLSCFSGSEPGSEKYVSDRECASAFCELVSTLATSVDGAADQLQQMGASAVLVPIMAAHAKDVHTVTLAAKALGLIKGGGADGLAALIDQVRYMSKWIIVSNGHNNFFLPFLFHFSFTFLHLTYTVF